MTIAGGVIRLTCGGIGTGKSYLNVKNAEQEKKSGKYKAIYSNIRAHAELAEGITLLPDDWRDCESDSLIIIDEIQMHEKFSKHFSNRRDSEIADLSMIRHKRLDIWMISPNPALVNSDVRNLVNQYVWLEIQNKKATKGWCFTKVHNNVTKAIKNTAYDEFTYSIEEKYYSLYKSTEDGKASGRNAIINMKLIGFVGGLAVITLIILGLLSFLMKSNSKNVEELSKTTRKEQTINPLDQSKNATKTIPPGQVDLECRKGENVSLPQCVEWYNNLTKNNLSVASVTYDPNKPYDLENIEKSITYEVTSKPKFAGCSYMNGKYRAYSEQGTYLNVSASDCKHLLDDPANRPYDYFRNTQQNTPLNMPNMEQLNDQNNRQYSSPLHSEQTTTQVSLTEQEKLQQYERQTREYQRSYPQNNHEINSGFG